MHYCHFLACATVVITCDQAVRLFPFPKKKQKNKTKKKRLIAGTRRKLNLCTLSYYQQKHLAGTAQQVFEWGG